MPKGIFQRKSSEQRFWTKVQKPIGEGCWIWTASKYPYGYGCIRFNGRNEAAHRVSWELHNGPIPDSMQVLHHCDNPPCVNPSHLFLGTNQDNIDDKVKKGRSVGHIGEKHPKARLTNEQARFIKSYPKGYGTCVMLSKMFNMSRKYIWRIRHDCLWKNI